MADIQASELEKVRCSVLNQGANSNNRPASDVLICFDYNYVQPANFQAYVRKPIAIMCEKYDGKTKTCKILQGDNNQCIFSQWKEL